jgi:YVTN family beta-propeller protein
VAAQKSHEVWKVNVVDNSASKFATIAVDSPPAPSPGFPTDVATTADGMLLVGNHDIDSISFIKSDGAVTTVSTGAGTKPWGGTFSPDGKKAYISTNGVNTVSVFDVATQKETAKITVGAGPDGFTWCKI